jgi:hypothetical protein
MNSLLLTDEYKLDHRRQYPKGTEFVYSNKGFTFPRVENLLRNCKLLGMKLVLFTAKETKEQIGECVKYCEERGYMPDFVNESPVMNTKKPYYNILLDDRAGLFEAVSDLGVVIAVHESRKEKLTSHEQ